MLRRTPALTGLPQGEIRSQKKEIGIKVHFPVDTAIDRRNKYLGLVIFGWELEFTFFFFFLFFLYFLQLLIINCKEISVNKK